MAACRAPGPHARHAHIPPPPALAQSPPATPSSVSLTRADGTLTASWDAVSNATKYHITYSSDGGYGWTAAADNHTGTSITISVDNSKSYIVAVRAGNDNGWSGWRNSAAIAPITLPGTVQSLNAARSGTGITVSWTAPANTGGLTITGYDVNYSTNGAASWTRAVSGTNSTSADISNADNTVDYIVSVRANNALGGGAWTNSSTLPGLDAPASATISRAAGSVTVTWSAVAGATGYNINLSADGGGSWSRAASNATGTSATISSGISNGASYIAAVQAVNAHGGGNWTNSGSVAGIYPPGAPTGVTAARSGTGISVSWTAPTSNGGVAISGYDINYSTDEGYTWARAVSGATGTSATIDNADNAVDYEITVSARNTVGSSAWVRTATVTGIDAPAAVTVFRHRNTTGSGPASYMDAGWTAVSGATGYDVNYIFGDTWHTRAADNVTGTTYRIVDGLYHQSHFYVVAVRARNAHGPGPWTNSPPADETRTLTASNITLNSATLTLDTYSSTWHYKADKGPHNTCSSGQSGINVALSDLSAGETYTYTACSDSGCSATLATAAAFTLPGVSVSNLTNGGTSPNTISATSQHAAAFTTGSHPGGYTLHSFTARMQGGGGTGDLSWAIHEASTDSDPKPATTITNTTFSGSNPPGTTYYVSYTFTCAGSGCTLDPDTTYFLVGSSSGNALYNWIYTTDLSETAAPSDNGWSIGKGWLRSYSNNVWGDWVTYNDISRFKVSATLGPTLAAASDTATTATLSISHHSGAWWYKGNQSGATCTPVAAGTSSASLSSLTAGTSYTYKAYDTSGCASTNEIATLTFTQGTGFRDSGKDFNTLSAAGNTDLDGIWSDGTTMWVQDKGDAKAYAYTLATKARDSGKDISFTGIPIAMGSDGTTMWISDLLSGAKLLGYSISGKSRDTSKDITLHADNGSVAGLWANSATIWVGDGTDEYIYAYTISGGARDSGKDIDLHADNANIGGLWSDGTTMWVADHTDDKLYAYKMSDGSRDSAKDYDLHSENGHALGIWSDGTTMWVADDDKLYAYHAIGSQPSNTSGSARLGSSRSAMVSSMTAPIPPQGTDAPLNPATAFASGFSGSPGQATGTTDGGAAAGLPGYVSSLTSAQSGGTQLKAGDLAGGAFTTGPHPDGYTLDSVTATLAAIEGEADLVWTLHELAGDTYGADSQPAPTARATLTGTAPTADEFTDLTYTCAGDGCALAPNTTYFVVAESVGSGLVSWAFIFSSASLSETTVPTNNGWSLGHGHYSADGVTWTTFEDWQHTRLDFTPR